MQEKFSLFCILTKICTAILGKIFTTNNKQQNVKQIFLKKEFNRRFFCFLIARNKKFVFVFEKDLLIFWSNEEKYWFLHLKQRNGGLFLWY